MDHAGGVFDFAGVGGGAVHDLGVGSRAVWGFAGRGDGGAWAGGGDFDGFGFVVLFAGFVDFVSPGGGFGLFDSFEFGAWIDAGADGVDAAERGVGG